MQKLILIELEKKQTGVQSQMVGDLDIMMSNMILQIFARLMMQIFF